MEHPGSLDTWVEFVTVPWTSEDASGRYVEAIVHLQTYLQRLVVTGSVPVASRAAVMLLNHPPVDPSSRLAIAGRFPQTEEI